MSLEKPKPLTEQQIKQTESRILSDAEFIKDGAKIKASRRLDLTADQLENAKQKMEGPYFEEININGIEFRVSWDEWDNYYTIYFPQLNPTEQVIRIGKNRETAKQVFDFVCQEAERINDVNELHNKALDFINNVSLSQ